MGGGWTSSSLLFTQPRVQVRKRWDEDKDPGRAVSLQALYAKLSSLDLSWYIRGS